MKGLDKTGVGSYASPMCSPSKSSVKTTAVGTPRCRNCQAYSPAVRTAPLRAEWRKRLPCGYLPIDWSTPSLCPSPPSSACSRASDWPSTRAKRVLAALENIGWRMKAPARLSQQRRAREKFLRRHGIQELDVFDAADHLAQNRHIFDVLNGACEALDAQMVAIATAPICTSSPTTDVCTER